MSKQIDERVVSMEFDNRDFEKNIQSSINFIERLKSTLTLKNAYKGIEAVGETTKKTTDSISGLGGAVESVQLKFNALYTVADQTLRNITNSATKTAKRVYSAFVTDPIRTGFQEYETQIKSVQTILANTESKGSTLQDVNNALAELNTYADKTIYNFTEMTRNIGTFTAAGVDLKTSVSAIKGIANLAAVSGSTSQQASTAMYQLSQALSSGTVKLMDWNSVVNAGMGGQVFQDALKETARVHNIKIDEMIKKEGSFRETLQEGWLTAEILTETLSKFTGDLSESQLKAMGYTDEQIKKIVKMGETANDAATKVKTFTQLFDTLKEAAQSGWTKSWELLIGDFGEAKELLTDISNLVGGIIGDSADQRNALLMGGLATGWKQLLNEGINDAAGFEEMVSNVAKEHGVDIASMINEENSFQDVLKKSLKEGTLTSDVLGESITKFSDKVSKMSSAELEAAGYTKDHVKQLKELNDKVQNGTLSMEEFAKLIVRPSGRELLIESLWNTIKGLQSVLTPVKEAFEDIFPTATGEQLYKIIEGIRDFTTHLTLSSEQSEKLKTTFKGVFSVIKVGVDIFKDIASGCVKLIGAILPVGNGLLDTSASLGEFLMGVSETIGKVNILEGIFNGLASILQSVSTGIGSVLSSLAEGIDSFGGILGIIQKVSRAVWDFLSKVITPMPGNSIFETLSDLVNGGILATIGIWIGKFIKSLTEVAEGTGGFLEKLKGIPESVTKVLTTAGDALKAFTGSIKADILKKIAIAIGILAASLLVLSFIKPERLAIALGGMAVLIKALMSSLSTFDKLGNAGKFTGVGKLTGAIIGISSALLILSLALKIMGSMEWHEMLIGLGGMVIGLQALVKALNMLPKRAADKAAETLKKLASSLVILSIALKIMGSMSWQEMAVGIGGMALALGALVGALHLLPKKTLNSSSKAFMKLATSLTILAIALKIMGSMSWQEMAVGIGGMTLALGALVGALHLLPKNMANKAKSILILSSAMTVLAIALKIMGSISWQEMTVGLGGMVIALAALVDALYMLPKDIIGKATGVVILASAMLVLGMALKVISSISWEGLAKGITSIILLFGIFIGVAYALAPIAGVLVAIGGGVALLGLGCLAAGAGLILISTGLIALASAIVGTVGIILGGANELIGVFTTIILSLVTAIVACVPAITDGVLQLLVSVIAGLAKYTPQLVNSLFDFLIGLLDAIAVRLPELIQSGVNLFMSFFQGVVQALGTVDTTTLIQGIAAVGLIAGLIVALSALTPFIPGAMVAVLGIGVLVAELGLVLAAIGALAQIPGLEWLISEGGDFLQTVGTAIGQFLGGIVGGFAEGALSTLPEIGLKLSEFMMNATPFITGAQMINPSTLDGVKSLAEIILLLTAADILDGLTSWLTGGSSLTDFGKQLSEFGPYISAFAESVKGINTQAVTAASNAAKMLAEMADSIPSDWGNNNITKFGSQIEDFAKSIVSFSDTVGGKTSGINSAVTAVKDAIASLSQIATTNADGIKTFNKTLTDIAQNGIKGFTSAFTNSSTEIIQAISGFMTTISTTLDTEKPIIYEKFKLVGAYSVDGLLKGIDDNMFKASEKGAALAAELLEAVKKELGIHSPSLVFNKEVGRYIVQGIAEGITADMSAEEAAEKKAQNIVNAFKKAFDRNSVYSNINDNELELWKLTDGLSASKSEIAAKEIEYFTKNLTYSLDNQSKAYDKWKEMTKYFGETSDEAKQAWEEYRKYQVKVAEDQRDINKKKSESELIGIEDEIVAIERAMEKNDYEYNKWLSTVGKYASDEELYKAAAAKYAAEELHTSDMLDSYKRTLDYWNNMTEGAYTKEELAEKRYEAEQNVRTWEQKLIDVQNGKDNPKDEYRLAELTKNQEERALERKEYELWLRKEGKYAEDSVRDVKELTLLHNELESLERELTDGKKELLRIAEEYGKDSEEYRDQLDKNIEIDMEIASKRDEQIAIAQRAIDRQIEAADMSISNLDLQYQLWEKTLGRNATVAEKNVAKLGMLSQQLSSQSNVVQIARDEWTKAEREYGKASDEAQAAYNRYLSEQLELANLQSEITDINESTVERQKAAKYDYKDYIKNYEKFYEMNGMTKEQLEEDAKLISGYDPSNTLTTMLDKTNDMFATLTSSDSYKSMISGFSSMGTACVEAVSQSIDSSCSTVKDSAGTMLEEVTAVLREDYDEWVLIGKDLVQGFVNGIVSTIPLAVVAASALGEATKNAAKEAFDEHSPSRVFAEIGMYAVQGLANGLTDNTFLATDAINTLSGEAIEGLKSTIQAIAEFVDSDIDSEPTIRPVLDLSDVERGTATLNSMFSRTQAVKASASMKYNNDTEIQNGDNAPKAGNSYQFVQNNYSPKALSRTEIYRQTRNQLSTAKGVLS